MNKPQLSVCIIIRVHPDGMLLLFERNVLCYHQVSSPQHQFVFSRVCGFCLDLEEVGAEAGEEKMGIEPEVER